MGMPARTTYEPGSLVTNQKLRRSAETIKTLETRPVLPYTGKDFSDESMRSAVDFSLSHSMPEWHSQARCRELPQEMFFGKDNDVTSLKRHRPTLTMPEEKRAKAVCDRCPVKQQCMVWALVNHEEYGVWGGMSQRDRQRWWRANNEVLRHTEDDLT